ncbi:hypothetical protein FEM48_Zijuj01G0238600 [Ziziphus jujuba var. spinosa]|uniref:Polygalacturonase At3g15720 n=1 Tax=Ziziphus jujuba var. spinosa TaxID=714518 RepID=A0A978W4A6_ZIZJJ|nr:hypothetical protein FEM48_Zijuj01G0238600 [Ziziphus jujuba var. spinosa]
MEYIQKHVIRFILLICIAWSNNFGIGNGTAVFNVLDYGAVGDAKHDDSQAFLKAWKAVCGVGKDSATLEIPYGKTFLLQPTRFAGPCNTNSPHVQVLGKIVAPETPNAWKLCGSNSEFSWITFSSVQNLIMDGSGEIDGQGSSWWNVMTVLLSAMGRVLSTLATLHEDLICIFFNSVGSLGKHGDFAGVEEVRVHNCSFNGTQNGARIKTWQGGRGYARKIHFDKITLIAAQNPIIIDQKYCAFDSCNNPRPSVEVSDITYSGVQGTSADEQAITISCSAFPG